MGKKKKKYYNDSEYDYSEFNYNGDIRKLMYEIADSIEGFIEYSESNLIYVGMTEESWNKNMKTAKKLIKKLRKGDPSVFNIEEFNAVIASGHSILAGID